jgi:serine/threonine-protein kinase
MGRLSLAAPRSPLGPGSLVGPYQVLSTLGSGGMGEVYRARDSRLNRDVAIKVLSSSVTHDADRLARFAREAQLLASLNHPNIAQVHGLEDASGQPALIMELVEGQTLGGRMAAGLIPLDEALAIARQIADALDAAHTAGIVHRDLKPANIKVREDGTVKVLDFGLAKAFDRDGAAAGAVTNSPTISAHATAVGIILGTAAYMSPEQARGRAVDKRADIWAFGVVLYEMLTGRRAFDADDISETLRLVLTKAVDWSALPASTPAPIRQLLRRCLERDIKRRIPDIAVARLEIDEALTLPVLDEPVSNSLRPARTASRWLVGFGAGVLLSAAAMWALTRVPSGPVGRSAPIVRFGITLPLDEQLALSFNDRDLALSPDGTHLVYVAGADAQLTVRTFDRLDPQPLEGITNARAPFVSSDGRNVGFFDRIDEGLNTGPAIGGVLKRVPIDGGPPTVVAQVIGGSRGASWSPDDSIVFATSDPKTGILRVSARGGNPEVLTRPDPSKDERDHQFPSWLPGGRSIVFTILKRINEHQVAVLDVATGGLKTVLASGSQATYVDSGHLVYVDNGTLWAVRFDLRTLEVVGDPIAVLERVCQRIRFPRWNARLRAIDWRWRPQIARVDRPDWPRGVDRRPSTTLCAPTDLARWGARRGQHQRWSTIGFLDVGFLASKTCAAPTRFRDTGSLPGVVPRQSLRLLRCRQPFSARRGWHRYRNSPHGKRLCGPTPAGCDFA